MNEMNKQAYLGISTQIIVYFIIWWAKTCICNKLLIEMITRRPNSIFIDRVALKKQVDNAFVCLSDLDFQFSRETANKQTDGWMLQSAWRTDKLPSALSPGSAMLCGTRSIIKGWNGIEGPCTLKTAQWFVYGLKPEVWGRVGPDPRAELQVDPARGPVRPGDLTIELNRKNRNFRKLA